MSQVRWDAGAYESVSAPQLAWGRRLLEQRTWRGDETVLDAGCGPGTMVEDILRRIPNGRVVAVDNDPSMVARAQDQLAKHGARVEVRTQDLQHLAVSESFDVVYSNAVLHWVPDHDAVFASFLKHLKPGGELLVQCGGEGNLQRIRGVASDVMRSQAFRATFEGWAPSWHYEDDTSTQERLLIAGFVHPNVSLESAPVRFADVDAFRRFGEAVVLRPYMQRLGSLPDQARFVDEFVRRVAASNEGLVYDYVRLNVRAQRSPHH